MNSSTAECCECRISRDFEVLRQMEIFDKTPVEIIKLFAYLARRRRYEAGETIIRQGDSATSAFLLMSGEVEVSVKHRDRDIVVKETEESYLFGELALLSCFDWFFSVKAKTDVEVLIIDREAFKKIVEKYPEKRDKITNKIIQYRIARFQKQTLRLLDQILEAETAGSSVKNSIII